VLTVSNIDGIMATDDILDDLILVNYLYKEKHDGKGFLDGKVLMGSMNRTGLAGAVHEGPKQLTIEPLSLRFDANDLQLR